MRTSMAILSVIVVVVRFSSNESVLTRAPQSVGFSKSFLGTFFQQSFGPALAALLGVGNGRFALELFETWPQGVIFLVDPYIHLRRGYDREENVDDVQHQRTYEHLRNVLHEMPSVQGRYSFVREFSFVVPKHWLEKNWGPAPRVVFNDANPSYGAVLLDLRTWWPLLARGGLLAGTNYTTSGDGSVVGVRRAVDEFAIEAGGLQVYITDDPEPVWLLLKEGD